MQTLFYCDVSFLKRLWQTSYLTAAVLFIMSLPLFFVKVNLGTFVFGSILICTMIICLVIFYKECVYWIQELSLFDDSNCVRIVYYKFDERLDVIEGSLSDFEFF